MPAALVGRGRVLYLEGYLWDLPPAKEAMRRAIGVAHDSDGSVALSLSDAFCVDRHRRDFLDLLLGDVDVLFANEEEITRLFGTRLASTGRSPPPRRPACSWRSPSGPRARWC